jgi:Tfp pilus assembly protein FimT
MSTIEEPSSKRDRTVLYVVVMVIAAVLVVIGLVTYRGQEKTEEAEAKADQLISVIEGAGREAPDKDVIVGLLGDDGGATCRDPNAALNQATLRNMLFNGSGGPGGRPSLAAGVSVQGQIAIISVYCPDELEDFQEFIDDLDFDNDLVDE